MWGQMSTTLKGFHSFTVSFLEFVFEFKRITRYKRRQKDLRRLWVVVIRKYRKIRQLVKGKSLYFFRFLQTGENLRVEGSSTFTGRGVTFI